jgi:pectin methylesterase-like acyl-CoA thioesterase
MLIVALLMPSAPATGAGALAPSALTATSPSLASAAATLCVAPEGANGCFATIQAAVNAAISGDTITVAAGTYRELVTINGKTLTITGAGPTATIVEDPSAIAARRSTSARLGWPTLRWPACCYRTQRLAESTSGRAPR